MTLSYQVTNSGNVAVHAVHIAEDKFTGSGTFAAPATCTPALVLPAQVAIASSVPLFALSSLSIHQIRQEPVPGRPQRHRRVWRQVHDGLRFVVGNGFLRAVGLAAAAFQFFFAATMSGISMATCM